MRIHYTFQGVTRVFDPSGPSIVIGRPKPGLHVDLDMTPDDTVSRPHARVWREKGSYWVEDLRSTHGTQLNGEEIRHAGRRRLQNSDTLQIGVTAVVVEMPPEEIEPALKTETLPGIEIAGFQDAAQPLSAQASAPQLNGTDAGTNFTERLAMLCELPLQMSADRTLDALFDIILKRLVQVIPGAQRAVLLMHDPASGELLPRAYLAPDGTGPAVSETLARRSIAEGRGIIWLRGGGADPSASILLNRIESGMYTPMLWKGKALGVISVDNPHARSPFTDGDLRLLVAVAQYAAMAVENHRLAEDLRVTVKIQERLLTHFSPKLRQKLLERARLGRLRAGGERSEVTILSCDMRGFTRVAASLDPEDVVDMLNEYLPALTAPIMQYDGTIDKFVGDAVLAIFGSPEPDLQQHEKAVRASLAMQMAAARVSASRRERDQPVCEVGIGIHCGQVVHGFVGSQERMEFTVIGDAVNRATRYCDGARGGQVLISPEVLRHVHRLVEARELEVEVKHGEKLRAHLVAGLRTGLTPDAAHDSANHSGR